MAAHSDTNKKAKAPIWGPGPVVMLYKYKQINLERCELVGKGAHETHRDSCAPLVAAACAFFERYNRRPRDVLSIIGSNLTEIT
jgi:hypothetical protein